MSAVRTASVPHDDFDVAVAARHCHGHFVTAAMQLHVDRASAHAQIAQMHVLDEWRQHRPVEGDFAAAGRGGPCANGRWLAGAGLYTGKGSDRGCRGVFAGFAEAGHQVRRLYGIAVGSMAAARGLSARRP